MPIVDMLINGAANYHYLSFIDGYSSYNQIIIVKEDMEKIAFRYPRAIGIYE